VAAAGYYFWENRAGTPSSGAAATGRPFAAQTVNGLTVNLYAKSGGLRFAENEITIEFRDAANNEPVDVGSVKFDLDMNMPGMVMHSASTITPTGEPGRYRAKIKPDMAGDWVAKLTYDGPRGQGSASFTVNVAQ
jgi:hypothetical protein